MCQIVKACKLDMPSYFQVNYADVFTLSIRTKGEVDHCSSAAVIVNILFIISQSIFGCITKIKYSMLYTITILNVTYIKKLPMLHHQWAIEGPLGLSMFVNTTGIIKSIINYTNCSQ